ncbi:hypothetical protein ACFL2Q_08185 [Thermodesulfobacteriota bacterium]
MPLDRSECLGAMVVGLHFSSPWYTVANSFNYILDEVSELPGFEIRSMSHHELAFRTEQLDIILNQSALITKSPLFMAEKLLGMLGVTPTKTSTVRLPTRIFGSQQEFIKTDALAPNVAAAGFDFQIVPREAKTIEDFGGVHAAMECLSFGLGETIDSSRFMEFSNKE